MIARTGVEIIYSPHAVEGFKKGVAEHLSPTDYDTHFNLGIAYREMGLLDEAIGEFQIAAKEPSHLVLCCSMLGLCFLDKGLPELAIRWYRRGLDTWLVLTSTPANSCSRRYSPQSSPAPPCCLSCAELRV